MHCRRNFVLSWILPAAIVLGMMVAVGPASAQVELRWSPQDTTIAPGESLRLGIHLDDPVNLRTIEVTVTYDTTLVESLGGGPGMLYQSSGHFVLQSFEEEAGRWHGFAIVMSAGEFITGPGELLYWDVTGLVEGVCPIQTVEVQIYDEQPQANPLNDVILADNSLIIHDTISAVHVPAVPSGGLQIYPNPFNPRVQVGFQLENAAQGRLTVHDARGHRVTELHRGLIEAGPQVFSWDGTDESGRFMPAGVYVFQLQTGHEVRRAKAVLVK